MPSPLAALAIATSLNHNSWYSHVVYAAVHRTQPGTDRNIRKCESIPVFEVVAVAASAGGITALKELIRGLPAEFPCPILVVQHLPPAVRYRSLLDKVLAGCTVLNVRWAQHGEVLRSGTILLAPQDHHLEIVRGGIVCLMGGNKVNGSRPAADPLFSSVAAHCGPKGIAVVLSGALRDGAEGAYNVAAAGGRVLVQSRESAFMPDMPSAAIRRGAVDFEFSPRMIAHSLIALTMAPGAAAWFQVRNRGGRHEAFAPFLPSSS